MPDSYRPPGDSMKEYIFRHLVEVLLLSGLILLLLTATVPVYERGRTRSQLAGAYKNMHELVEALLVYSHEQPTSVIFPPDPDMLLPGINLCPIVDPLPKHLAFLTSPTAYLQEMPNDPFLSQAVQHDLLLTPFVAHWVKSGNQSSLLAPDYSTIGWGAFSIGPALKLPPQYSITVLRRVPYETFPLRSNLYHSSNGLTSMGLVYYDSLGNHSDLKNES